MKMNRNAIFQVYNQPVSPDKQGEDGDAGGFVPHEYPDAAVGLRRDTRRECETARLPPCSSLLGNSIIREHEE